MVTRNQGTRQRTCVGQTKRCQSSSQVKWKLMPLFEGSQGWETEDPGNI